MEIDPVVIEHRLTALEAGQAQIQKTQEANFEALLGKAERQQVSLDRVLAQTTATNNRVTKLEARPAFMSPISPAEATQLIAQHRDIWTVWRFSRWFIPLSIPIIIFLGTIVVQFVIHYH